MDTDMRHEVNGLEFNYRQHGRGPTLVLLHAFPLNLRMWEPQFAGLSDVCQVVALDLRNFGASQRTDEHFSLEDMARDVHDLMAGLGYGRYVLGGCSMGGYIAFALLRRYPEAVRGLVLANTRAGADTPAARENRLAAIEEAQAVGARKLAKSFPQNALCAATREARPELVERLESWIAETDPRAIIGAQRAMADRPDAHDMLGAIRVPTLVIAGEADTITPAAEAATMATAIPGAEFVSLAGAGHLANLEQPEAFNATVRRLMATFTG